MSDKIYKIINIFLLIAIIFTVIKKISSFVETLP